MSDMERTLSPLARNLQVISDATLFGFGHDGMDFPAGSPLARSEMLYVPSTSHTMGMTALYFLDGPRRVTYMFPPGIGRENPLEIIREDVDGNVVTDKLDARIFIETDKMIPMIVGKVNFEWLLAQTLQIDLVGTEVIFTADSGDDVPTFGGEYDDGVYGFIDRKAREFARLEELLGLAEKYAA